MSGFSFRGFVEEVLQWQTECLWIIRCFKFFQRKELVSQGGADCASCSDRQEFEPAGNLQPTESGMLVCWHLVTGRCLTLLEVFCFIYTVFLCHKLKLRTVRTSFHQRGSMWTTLKNAWPCVRWSASKESQPVHFRYLRKPTMWPLYRRSTPLGSVNGCSSTTAQPRRNWVSFHPTSTVRYKTTAITTLERGRNKPHSHNLYHLWFRCSFAFPAVCSGRCQLGAVREHLR